MNLILLECKQAPINWIEIEWLQCFSWCVIIHTIDDAQGSKSVRSEKVCSDSSLCSLSPSHLVPFPRASPCYQPLVYLSRDNSMHISRLFLTKARSMLCPASRIFHLTIYLGDSSMSVPRSYEVLVFWLRRNFI